MDKRVFFPLEVKAAITTWILYTTVSFLSMFVKLGGIDIHHYSTSKDVHQVAVALDRICPLFIFDYRFMNAQLKREDFGPLHLKVFNFFSVYVLSLHYLLQRKLVNIGSSQ